MRGVERINLPYFPLTLSMVCSFAVERECAVSLQPRPTRPDFDVAKWTGELHFDDAENSKLIWSTLLRKFEKEAKRKCTSKKLCFSTIFVGFLLLSSVCLFSCLVVRTKQQQQSERIKAKRCEQFWNRQNGSFAKRKTENGNKEFVLFIIFVWEMKRIIQRLVLRHTESSECAIKTANIMLAAGGDCTVAVCAVGGFSIVQHIQRLTQTETHTYTQTHTYTHTQAPMHQSNWLEQ